MEKIQSKRIDDFVIVVPRSAFKDLRCPGTFWINNKDGKKKTI